MSKRTAWLCIGLPHTGGPAVAAAAARHADTLRAHGIGLPAASAEEMRRASAELLREHGERGYRRRDVEGAWASICRRAWREKGATLLGDERLAAATDDQVALLLDGLAGLRPRAVVALRDPATLLVEGWASEVREGRAPTFERYAQRVLDPDEEHGQAARFRSGHDLPALLDRWTSALGPHRVHLVVLPPGRDPGVALWPELLELLGVPAAGLTDPEPSAGPTGAAVQRQLNDALKPRLSRADRRDLLGGWLSSAGMSPAPPPSLPPDVLGEATILGEKWRARVAESGVDVRGRLDDLVPDPVSGGPAPDETGAAGQALTAWGLGRSTIEVARLRGRVAELEERNRALERKRTKLRRRLAHLGA